MTEFAQGELFEILEADGSLPEFEVRATSIPTMSGRVMIAIIVMILFTTIFVMMMMVMMVKMMIRILFLFGTPALLAHLSSEGPFEITVHACAPTPLGGILGTGMLPLERLPEDAA